MTVQPVSRRTTTTTDAKQRSAPPSPNDGDHGQQQPEKQSLSAKHTIQTVATSSATPSQRQLTRSQQRALYRRHSVAFRPSLKPCIEESEIGLTFLTTEVEKRRASQAQDSGLGTSLAASGLATSERRISDSGLEQQEQLGVQVDVALLDVDKLKPLNDCLIAPCSQEFQAVLRQMNLLRTPVSKDPASASSTAKTYAKAPTPRSLV